MWGRRNLDLDAWATALGVSNDTDGIAAVQHLDSELVAIIADLARLKNRLPESVRSGTYADAARDFVGTAAESLHESRDCLKTISEAFRRHERGES